jgi:hypothetical protein
MRRIVALAAAALVALATACAQTPSGGTAAPAAPPSAAVNAFHHRAAEVADAWERAGLTKSSRLGFVPLDPDRIVLPADPGFTAASKRAFTARFFTTHTKPPKAPARGHVTFLDGTSMAVGLVSPADALADLTKTTGDPCNGCQPLEITKIALGAVTVLTMRGNASVPAWMLTIAGLKAPFGYMAVADADTKPIPKSSAPGMAAARQHGIVGAANLISVDGTTVRFTLGVGDCDENITPLVYETADTVVLGGWVTTPTGVCDLLLKAQPVMITVARPVGDRALLDALTGEPLTVRPTR